MSLKFVFLNEHVHLFGSINIVASVMAYVVAFCISFPVGFILSRHIVFPESNLHGRVQFFRYALTTVTFIFLTVLFIKLFDAILNAFPHDKESYAMLHTITYTFINIIMAVLSYISQRKFTFKIAPVEVSSLEKAIVD